MHRLSEVQQSEFVSAIRGVGWMEEAKRRLAEPFFSQTQNGTGLGLWVSTEIVRKHGGYIRAQNIPGSHGACFAVVLPAAGAASVDES